MRIGAGAAFLVAVDAKITRLTISQIVADWAPKKSVSVLEVAAKDGEKANPLIRSRKPRLRIAPQHEGRQAMLRHQPEQRCH